MRALDRLGSPRVGVTSNLMASGMFLARGVDSLRRREWLMAAGNLSGAFGTLALARAMSTPPMNDVQALKLAARRSRISIPVTHSPVVADRTHTMLPSTDEAVARLGGGISGLRDTPVPVTGPLGNNLPRIVQPDATTQHGNTVFLRRMPPLLEG